MSDSLKSKAIKGVSWSFADNISSSGITFLVGLILARLLTPDEFGMIAMVAIFIGISNSIVDSGFSSALIRKSDVSNIDYNTVFYFNLFVGLSIYFLLYLIAPFVGSFFGKLQLVPITRVLSVVLVFNSLSIIQRTILVKNVDFKTQAKISFIASLLSGIIGIVMAFKGYGVWCLVGQQLSRQLFNALFLWIYNDWRPSLEFSYRSFKELFGFGSKLLLSGLIDTIYRNIYYVVIGRFYCSASLGQYTRAEQFSTIFSSNLTSVIQRVSYPVLSSIQDDAERLREAYRKTIKTTMLVTFACMIGLAAIAKPLILVLIGEKWTGAIYFLQIICFSEMLYPLHAINLNILQVKGKSDLFLKLEIIKKIIGIFPIVLGILWGIEVMLWSAVATSILCYFLNSHYSASLIGYSTRNQIEDILPILFISLIVGFVMWSMTFANLSIYAMLPLQCVIGLLLAIFIYERLRLDEYIETKNLLFSIRKGLWKINK